MRKRTVLTGAMALAALVAVGWATDEAVASPQMQDVACAPMSDRMALEGRASPYDSAAVMVGGGMAKVCYNRPALRGRTMIGGDAVPYGQVWRTGANEPTTIHVSVPVRIAGVAVEPGAYSLYTIPREGDEWTLIVNASTSHWGHERSYAEVTDQDLDRVPVRAERVEQTVERLTIRPMANGGGFVIEWQNSRVFIPIAPA